MLSDIIGLYVTWNDLHRAIQIKWVEVATEQSGDMFDHALVRIVKPVEHYV